MASLSILFYDGSDGKTLEKFIVVKNDDEKTFAINNVKFNVSFKTVQTLENYFNTVVDDILLKFLSKQKIVLQINLKSKDGNSVSFKQILSVNHQGGILEKIMQLMRCYLDMLDNFVDYIEKTV